MRASFKTIKFLAATTVLNAPRTTPLQETATSWLQGCGIRRVASQPLKSTGAILAANLPATLVSVAAVVGTASAALADTANDPTMIPLQHVLDKPGGVSPGLASWPGLVMGLLGCTCSIPVRTSSTHRSLPTQPA